MTLSLKIRPLLGVSLLAAGCQRAPSVDILGSFFPVWIFCAVAGVITAAVAREVIIRKKYESTIKPAVLLYPCIAATVAFVTWMIFFR